MTGKAIVVLLAVSSFAAEPQGGEKSKPPGGISPGAMAYNALGMVRLLEVPEIQDELKLTSEDKASLPLLRAEMAESGAHFERALRAALAQDRSLFVPTLMARSKEVDGQMTELLGEKFHRFRELRRQAFGPLAAATSDATVREGLGITEDQRTKFNAMRKAKFEEFLRSFAAGGGKAETGFLDRRTQEFMVIELQLFQDLMTPTQKSKWEQLMGAPFEMPQEVIQFVRKGQFGPRSEAPVLTERAKRAFKKRLKQAKDRPPGEDPKKPPL
jgi:hypothetical protein